MKLINYLIAFVILFSTSAEAQNNLSVNDTVYELNQDNNYFIRGIEQSPLIFSNHEYFNNSLQGSVYELLNKAQSSILILSFTFSDPEVIQIINRKASEGLDVQVVVDRAHLTWLSMLLDPSVRIDWRATGEGHMHHKVLVVDSEYVWVSSANITDHSLVQVPNQGIGFYDSKIGEAIHQEALDIATSSARKNVPSLVCSFGDQLLELYLLPHNEPKTPNPIETEMNEIAKQKLINLIDTAEHSIQIAVEVWTFKDASRAVIRAKQRGVQVDVVVGNASGVEEAVQMLLKAGIEVKYSSNHYKFVLTDHKNLLSGSLNLSMNAFSRNDESLIVLYNLSEEQKKVMEGVLEAAQLPIEMHAFAQ